MSRARERADGFAGGANNVFALNGQTVSDNYTLSASANAVTAGPVTIDGSASVTVSSGAVWVVV